MHCKAEQTTLGTKCSLKLSYVTVMHMNILSALSARDNEGKAHAERSRSMSWFHFPVSDVKVESNSHVLVQ